MSYQHYSFDLWLTLITANPMFKEARANYFYSQFNPSRLPLAEVTNIITEVSIAANRVNEVVGGNIDALEMYAWALNDLGNDLSSWSRQDLVKLYDDTEQIFFKYPPFLYSGETEKKLKEIRANGSSFSILSNTGFVKGRTLDIFLSETVIGRYSFALFSDQILVSKPSPKAFQQLINQCERKGIPKDQIIHIGDNQRADAIGATGAGINAMLINNISLTPATIKDI